MPQAGLLSLPQVAVRLGITHQRAHQLARAGSLKATRVGRTWVVTEAELARFSALSRPGGRQAVPPKTHT